MGLAILALGTCAEPATRNTPSAARLRPLIPQSGWVHHVLGTPLPRREAGRCKSCGAGWAAGAACSLLSGFSSGRSERARILAAVPQAARAENDSRSSSRPGSHLLGAEKDAEAGVRCSGSLGRPQTRSPFAIECEVVYWRSTHNRGRWAHPGALLSSVIT